MVCSVLLMALVRKHYCNRLRLGSLAAEQIASEPNVGGQQINGVSESSIGGSVTQRRTTTVSTTDDDGDDDRDDASDLTSSMFGNAFGGALFQIPVNSYTPTVAASGALVDVDGLDDYQPEYVQRSISNLYAGYEYLYRLYNQYLPY